MRGALGFSVFFVLAMSSAVRGDNALPEDAATSRLPAFVVSAPETAILTGSDGNKPVQLAWLAQGVPLEVKGNGQNGTLAVAIHGDVEATGFVRRDKLAVVVCEAGPLGERYYAGRGNLLQLDGAIVDGRVEVAGAVLMPRNLSDDKAAWSEQYKSLPFRTTIEVRRLCSKPLRKPAGTDDDPIMGHTAGDIAEDDFPAGTPFIDVKSGAAISFYDRPSGEILHTRSADRWGYSLARIAHKGKWDQVALGDGPYLLGWIAARPVRKKSQFADVLGGIMGNFPGPMGLHTDALRRLPLHEVAAGTELRQYGATVARLTRPGYARISPLRDGWRYAVIAVGDDIMLEGWLDPARIGRLVPETTKQSAAAPSAGTKN